MKNEKFLNIKGALLDNSNLKSFMEKIAASYEITNHSNKETYPINRLNSNYLFIEKTYNLLNEHIKQGIDIHPAGEWLLDNYYILEETVKKIKKEMPQKKYKEFPGIANGNYAGFARIYLIASLIVNYRDSIIDEQTLKVAISGYQKQRTLIMDEIWSINTFLEIAIIENIRAICEKIYASQKQKKRVEEIIQNTVEGNNKTSIIKPKHNVKVNNLKYEIKFPFIEYMSYKLKRYGKRGTAYLNILESEVNKIGFSIEDVIKKEHFDIAMQKVLIGNSISSIREIERINFLLLFEEINGVEEILKKDPSNVYSKMDYKTKAYYRNIIKEIAIKTKISEIYIANKVLEFAKKQNGIKAHVGFYLIDEGFNKLAKELGIPKRYYKLSNKRKAKMYISFIYTTTIISTFLAFSYLITTTNYLYSIILSLMCIIPISEIIIQTLNYFLTKKIKPKLIPKMDFSLKIPKEYATIVAIPTIINSPQKVKELMHSLEVYYMANKLDNLYFALLGDCLASKNEKEAQDEKIIQEGLDFAKELNNKYAKNQLPKFFFLYRNRTWNSGEKSYLGWERKRGLLNEFNLFLVKGIDKFKVNTINGSNLKIKYVITLDSDTKLCLDTAQSLIGTLAHILNTPKIENGIVKKGYGIIQPRVGVDLEASRKTFFSKIFAGDGGTEVYANAISNVYQDNFGEGIFTGKGIYDLEVFYKILEKEIPENMVLSHDLLEGSYLRCGLASDIFLIDGCPTKYNSYIARLHRWIRGDFQIINWLNKQIVIKDGTKKKNPLSMLSKFKLLDNLRRALVPVFTLIILLIGSITKTISMFWLGFVCSFSPTILNLIDYIVFKKNETNIAYKNIVKTIGSITLNVLKGLLEFLFLPNKAYISLDAAIRSLYRLKISKQKLLEWTTSEETEKTASTKLVSYIKLMKLNTLLGVVLTIVGLLHNNILSLTLGLLWLFAPYVAYKISKEKEQKIVLDNEDKEYLYGISKKTWHFFESIINEENNFLPPDNYQEDRKQKLANRTSPTNIGLRTSCTCFCF